VSSTSRYFASRPAYSSASPIIDGDVIVTETAAPRNSRRHASFGSPASCQRRVCLQQCAAPTADRHDQPGFFGQRYEVQWRAHAAVRVCQRTSASMPDQFAAVQSDDPAGSAAPVRRFPARGSDRSPAPAPRRPWRHLRGVELVVLRPSSWRGTCARRHCVAILDTPLIEGITK